MKSSLFKDCPLTFKKHFIKGPVYIAFKVLSVIRTLALGSAGFFQIMEFVVQRTWKESGSHLKLAWILRYIILSKENVRKIGTGTFFPVCSVL